MLISKGLSFSLTNKTLSETPQYPFIDFYVSSSRISPTPLSWMLPPECINSFLSVGILPAPFHLISLIPRMFTFSLSNFLFTFPSFPLALMLLTFQVAIFIFFFKFNFEFNAVACSSGCTSERHYSYRTRLFHLMDDTLHVVSL